MKALSKLVGQEETPRFAPFIKYVCFPHFKNMELGARIEFNYPITAIVGPNGSNKSSILRALQGAAEGQDVGKYWFETALDPIEMNENGRQRYYYGYTLPHGSIAEVLQIRVNRTGRLDDYFETDNPRPTDGMHPMPDWSTENDEDCSRGKTIDLDNQYRSKTRWKKVQKEVVYLDFRQELPAYDIYTSFNWDGQKRSSVQRREFSSKKEYIRRNSSRVKRALDESETTHVLYNRERILEPAVTLESDEIKSISQILGRRYTSISLVKHNFFGVEGFTARMASDAHNYSEAYAGSGEFAAIMLVHKVHSAPERSLILLDEPETSLHPGAQKELTRFLAKASIAHAHQIIMSTHAPAIIEELPANAIKTLDLNPTTHRVAVLSQSASPSEAFNRLGATFQQRTVLVEDDLAAEFVRRAAISIGADYAESINVEPVGGANRILNQIIPVQAQLDSNCIIILDGDQSPKRQLRSSSEISDDELEDELRLLNLSSKTVKSLPSSGGDDNNPSRIIDAERKAIDWIHRHVGFLPYPNLNPELLLLKMCKQMYSFDIPDSGHDAKMRWVELTRSFFHRSETESISARDIFSCQQYYLGCLLAGDVIPDEIRLIQQTLQHLLPTHVSVS